MGDQQHSHIAPLASEIPLIPSFPPLLRTDNIGALLIVSVNQKIDHFQKFGIKRLNGSYVQPAGYVQTMGFSKGEAVWAVSVGVFTVHSFRSFLLG